MVGIYRGWRAPQKLLVLGWLLISLTWAGCPPALALPFLSGSAAKKVVEASPPEAIQTLHQVLEKYQPQVMIVSPKANTVLSDNSVAVQFQVKDLPLFKDANLGLGPHLHVFLDDQPYQALYDVSQPLVLKDLTPGTHTIRAFAGRPWHESFKNEGAYAQTTFHVFTKTPTNQPDLNLPLLTYSRPQGSYGAEPIMLDFYLTNAPLHLVAQEDEADEFPDWRIQVTVNGDRFVVDQWAPLYLKGFKPGKNWVQIEYIDEQGQPVANAYNNTARLFTYEPGGQDALSQLVRGELTAAQAMSIVDATYVPSPIEMAPVPTPPPSVAPGSVPALPIAPIAQPTPLVKERPLKESPAAPVGKAAPVHPPQPTPGAEVEPEPSTAKPDSPQEPAVPLPPEAVAPATASNPVKSFTEQAKEKVNGLLARFHKTVAPTAPRPVPVEIEPEADGESEPVEVEPVKPPLPSATALPPDLNRLRRFPVTPPVVPVVPVVPSTPAPGPRVEAPAAEPPAQSFFDRFRQPKPKSSPLVNPAPEVVPEEPASPAELPAAAAPTSSPDQAAEPFSDRVRPPNAPPKPEPTVSPTLVDPPEPSAPVETAKPVKETPQDLINRFRRSPTLAKPAVSSPAKPPTDPTPNAQNSVPATLPRVAPASSATAPAWMFPATSPPPAFTDPTASEVKPYRVPPPRDRPLSPLPTTPSPLTPSTRTELPMAQPEGPEAAEKATDSGT